MSGAISLQLTHVLFGQYMCHVNFRPVEDSRLVFSAPSTPEEFAVRSTFPDHVKPSDEHKAFLARLAADPTIVNTMSKDVMDCLDPEVVAYLQYRADSDGWAHSLQVPRTCWRWQACSLGSQPRLVRCYRVTPQHTMSSTSRSSWTRVCGGCMWMAATLRWDSCSPRPLILKATRKKLARATCAR